MLVSQMLKVPLKLTNVWHKIPPENVRGQQKAFQNTQWYANSYVHKFVITSYILQSYPSK